MKFIWALPVFVVAQPPVMLYNGAPASSANCALKLTACDCHYAACSLAGVCACGWDDVSLTCQAGVTTKCVSCPAMNHCSVQVPLLIGANGFPVPGQLSVWAGAQYPDQSGAITAPNPRVAGTVQIQATAPIVVQSPVVVAQPPQPATSPVVVQSSSQSSVDQSSVDQSSAEDQSPTQLYQDNAMSAGSCTAKSTACACHYASCTASGDCICGWDTASKSCKAGVTTKCESCPAMHHCGTSEPLLIGPNGFPLPGQTESWGQVPYPDQTQSSGKGKGIMLATPAPTTAAPTPAAPTRKAGKGKKGKAGKKSTTITTITTNTTKVNTTKVNTTSH